MSEAPGTTERGIQIKRKFAAPRQRVWEAWTEPRHFAEWFGGREATIPLETVEMDVRPGGQWRATMYAGPERIEIHWSGEFREVAPPERLVFTLTDTPVDRPDVVTVVLTAQGDETEMVFTQRGIHMSDEEYGQAAAGWGKFFDRMAELVTTG